MRERPHAWRYRDYVVRAFNQDKPYDRFLREQIAGDEIYPGDQDALHRARIPPRRAAARGRRQSGRGDEPAGRSGRDDRRHRLRVPRHDGRLRALPQPQVRSHPAKPTTTACRRSSPPRNSRKSTIATEAGERRTYEAAKKAYEARLKPITDQIAEIEKPYRERLRGEEGRRSSMPNAAQRLKMPKVKRTPEQQTLAKEAEAQIEPRRGMRWCARSSPEDREKRAGAAAADARDRTGEAARRPPRRMRLRTWTRIRRRRTS